MSVRSYVHKDADEWKHDGWTSCPNRILRDAELPWELRGLWCWMASHTEDFEINGAVVHNAGPAGKNKSYEMIRELERRGLLTRHHELGDDGQPVMRYDLHPNPVPLEQRTAKPSTAKPRKSGFPTLAPVRESAPDQDIHQRSGERVFPDGGETADNQDIHPRSGDRPDAGRVPYRPVPTRPGEPYKEEKTTGEDQIKTSLALRDAQDQERDRDDVDQLCQRLHERVTANGSKATITTEWRKAARLLLDRDQRPLEKALNLIDWATADPFWSSNILSMPKFRKQYDQLRLKAIAEYREHSGQQARPSTTDQRVAAAQALKARFTTNGAQLAITGGAA